MSHFLQSQLFYSQIRLVTIVSQKDTLQKDTLQINKGQVRSTNPLYNAATPTVLECKTGNQQTKAGKYSK